MAMLRTLMRVLHRGLLHATTLLLWMQHRMVFRAGGYSLRELWKQSLIEGEVLLTRELVHATGPAPFAPDDRRS
jgi:hypothetical protein